MKRLCSVMDFTLRAFIIWNHLLKHFIHATSFWMFRVRCKCATKNENVSVKFDFHAGRTSHLSHRRNDRTRTLEELDSCRTQQRTSSSCRWDVCARSHLNKIFYTASTLINQFYHIPNQSERVEKICFRINCAEAMPLCMPIYTLCLHYLLYFRATLIDSLYEYLASLFFVNVSERDGRTRGKWQRCV